LGSGLGCGQARIPENTYKAADLTLLVKYDTRYDLEVWRYTNVTTENGYVLVQRFKGQPKNPVIKEILFRPLYNEGIYKGVLLTADTHTVLKRFDFIATIPATVHSRQYKVDLSPHESKESVDVTYDSGLLYKTCHLVNPDYPLLGSIQNAKCPTILVHGFSNNFSNWDDVLARIGLPGLCQHLGYAEETALPAIVTRYRLINFSYYYPSYEDWMSEVQSGKPGTHIHYGRIGDGNLKPSNGAYSFWGVGMHMVLPRFYYARETYAERLAAVVNSVLARIPAGQMKKVNLIGFSMGGLVARSYIRWYGGADKVHTLITVGTPNHGVRPYGAYIASYAKGFKFIPELLELSARREWYSPAERKLISFTDYLNWGDETYGSKLYGLNYYTIAFMRPELSEPKEPKYIKLIQGIVPDDGVVDAKSVALKGAKANILIEETYHTNGLTAMMEQVGFRNAVTEHYLREWLFK
jgi:pimeloyl-ACP methyl ester carboxylesterase